MYIKNIKLNNFRNLKKIDIKLDNKINFIIGDNAQGKTNFVEAIYYTAFLKSFRSQKNIDLLNDGEKQLSINLDVVKNKVVNNLYLKISKNSKFILLNGNKNIRKKYFEYLNVVIFHPEEVNYVSNYPVFRRNLIDRSIFYTNYEYVYLYKKYFRCLKQRNIYLKSNKSDTDIWKDQLIKYGAEIIKERLKYIEKTNAFFTSDLFSKINREEYLLEYSQNYGVSDSIENCLREDFSRKKQREYALGHTLVGPHKDDIIFYVNDKPAEGFASQGQKRSLVISFKIAQILDYKAVQGHYPVLILDDMSSELDLKRNNILLGNLLENSGQVFITSTEFKQINYLDQTKVFKVENGEISAAD